ILKTHGLPPDSPLFKGKGCNSCNNTGYRGRTCIFELFTADDQLEEMISSNRRESEIREYLSSRELKTLIFDGLKKAVNGITTISEVERAISG
ncbi:MAG: general secretion pathway protein GspE, partial [Spirochaetes bacterium]|nr:general secretion pathway protein GspE [Spirochaetota bacterium]